MGRLTGFHLEGGSALGQSSSTHRTGGSRALEFQEPRSQTVAVGASWWPPSGEEVEGGGTRGTGDPSRGRRWHCGVQEGAAGPVRTSGTDPVGTLDGHAGHPLSSVQIQGERLGEDWGPYSPFPEKRDQESEHLTSLSCCEDQPPAPETLVSNVRKEGSDTNSRCGRAPSRGQPRTGSCSRCAN